MAPVCDGRWTVPRRAGGVKSGPRRKRFICFSASALISGVRSLASSGDALRHERGRPGRERLRRVRPLAGRVGRRVDGTLLDRPHGAPGHAIEHVDESLLGYLCHGIDRPSVDGDRHEIGRRAEVVVPQTVVHRLKVPLARPGGARRGNDRFGKQVGARTPAAPVVAGWRAGRRVQQPARFIERHRRPHVRMPCSFPGAVAPRVGSDVPGRLRDRVEDPGALARPDVERLHRPGGIAAVLQSIRHAAAHDHQVPEHHRRRRRLRLQSRDLAGEAGGERGRRRARPNPGSGRPLFASTEKSRCRPAMSSRASPAIAPPECKATAVETGAAQRRPSS